jgi:hypothetical protein
MAKENDPAMRVWREALQCLIHPHLPLTSTLIEMEDKLAAVNGFLATIDAADPQQAAHAVAVGWLAVKYADELLDHFGLVDSGGPTPPPANLTQARLVVGNLLAFVQERIRQRQLSLIQGGEDAADDELNEEEGMDGQPTNGGQAQPADAPQLVVDRDTFTVRWGGRTCGLGYTKEFLLIETLSRRPGKFFDNTELTDAVWDGDDPEPNTVQKTVSNLRRKLAEAGMHDLVIVSERRGHYMLKLP